MLFVVADGVIKGKGNDKPTSEIVLNILGRTMKDETISYEYNSLGEADKKLNRAKVYSGIYNNRLPYIVIVKVGNEYETHKPGNRGKRDSQLLLFQFISNIFYNNELNELQRQIYNEISNTINVKPELYEFLMCIDSDTKPLKESLKHMVYKMNDNKILGLCGETRISNPTESWVTMIQIYEYYINHNLTKAFESLFGNVTCLPGCFSIYRLKSIEKKKPYLINKDILKEYSLDKVDTLHLKNLLHLGEDRYLTTLLLSYFPNYKLKYIIEARCETTVPSTWTVLLSQRRRWINSTIHNLFELVSLPGKMCGVFIFSMRFTILLDLISTMMLPASMFYLYYLIYLFATGQEKVQTIFIVVFSIVYGIQILIFVIKREYEYFLWLIIYIISMPIWNIILPLYSFWKFDDFSWGKTREIEMGIELTEIVTDNKSIDSDNFSVYKSPTETQQLDIHKLIYKLNIYKESQEETMSINDKEQQSIFHKESQEEMMSINDKEQQSIFHKETQEEMISINDKDSQDELNENNASRNNLIETQKNEYRKNSRFMKLFEFWNSN